MSLFISNFRINMKYYCKVLALFAALLISLFSFVLWLLPRDDSFYLNAYMDKYERLRNLSSPKVVVIGGSTAAFGVDSKKIETSLGFPVVNMGIAAGLGLEYIMDDVDKLLSQGDYVFVFPEYHQFISLYNGEPVTLGAQMYVNKFHGVRHLNFSQIWNMIKGLPNAIKYTYGETTYKYDEYGDEISRREVIPQKVTLLDPLIKDPVNARYIRRFEMKLRMWHERGVNVMVFPCFINESSFNLNKDVYHKIDRMIGLNVFRFVVPIESHVFNDSFTYDGPYHLNVAGLDYYSAQLDCEISNCLQ